ncbi:hypothetical protein NECAME_16034 [Necator americanus]|uniref:Uncharacterized protein n=1 Tax=Necator americanus TaxID=51031 RepID=W2U0S7_NECAM|nr:hypothetical protein NECAME_16034 [Necator americanus]ETN86961.1 hypothetical protein NECAME_16034 [Necator americanus]
MDPVFATVNGVRKRRAASDPNSARNLKVNNFAEEFTELIAEIITRLGPRSSEPLFIVAGSYVRPGDRIACAAKD